jgi:hypothetical protein
MNNNNRYYIKRILVECDKKKNREAAQAVTKKS